MTIIGILPPDLVLPINLVGERRSADVILPLAIGPRGAAAISAERIT